MSMNGIIEFKDSLLRADCVLYAEQVDDNVDVTTNCPDLEITYSDCRLADFRDAWRRALNY